jgi:prepilin-type N-terminal cleavage/methylation domain-containing protein
MTNTHSQRGRQERGVTLIELLVVITLIAAISTGLLMAMRIALNTMEKTQRRLEENRRAMSIQQLIGREIGGVMPVLADCGGSRGAFNGTVDTLHLVTSYSLEEGSRGYPRVVQFRAMQDPGGGVRLVMTERIYSGPASTAAACPGYVPPGLGGGPLGGSGGEMVLAENLAYCRFAYHEVIPEAIDAGNWVYGWDRPSLPSAVRVEMAPREFNASQLPIATLHIPIHITREMPGFYVDEQ